MNLRIYILSVLLSVAISTTIEFSIDMSNQEFPTEDYTDVVINGSWNDWSGWGVTLNDDNQDQIYTGSLEIANPGDYQYVIALTGADDNWSGWGQIINAPLGSFCDFHPEDEWANYGFSFESNINITQSYCAGTCDEFCDPGSDDGEDTGGENNHDIDGYTLVWSDEFNGDSIDESKWNFEVGNGNWGWGNGESQYYRSQNASIQDGKLIIEARNENYGGFNYTSTRMQTKNKGDWLYGKIKASIKVPSGGGTWPAFWMMPTESVYGGWPNSGEIDIMEHYGCDNMNENNPFSTVHNSLYNWNGGIPPTSYPLFVEDATTDFHEYELIWTENELNFFINNIPVGTYFKTNSGWQQWPYDQEFYIILNLAIGSHYMACETENSVFPQTMEVDYVRVYQYVEECTISGDLNNDEIVNVTDVVQLVGTILNPEDSDYFSNCSDLNQDGVINITDIVMLVSIILNP